MSRLALGCMLLVAGLVLCALAVAGVLRTVFEVVP